MWHVHDALYFIYGRNAYSKFIEENNNDNNNNNNNDDNEEQIMILFNKCYGDTMTRR